MGTMTDNRAALDAAYATGTERIGVELDGQAPAPKPAPAPAPAPVAKPAAVDTGPGFWSRLGDGIASVAGKTADVVGDVASRVEFGPISGARGNAIVQAQAARPRQDPPYGMILGAIAAAVFILYVTMRRP